MSAIIPFLGREAVFEPHDIQTMSIALDDICQILNLPNKALVARQVIAERIIELSRQGVGSSTVLRDRVLQEAGLGEGLNERFGRSGR